MLGKRKRKNGDGEKKNKKQNGLTNEQGTELMREKLKNAIKEANGDITKIKIKPGNKLVQQPDGTVKMVMTCVGPCKQDKERVPINFTRNHKGKKWQTSLPGYEHLNNFEKYPCIECYNRLRCEHTTTKQGKIDQLLSHAKIPLIEGRKWIKTIIEKQNGNFFISNLPINFTTKSEWMPSIQNLKNGHAHQMETCELIEAEFNVRQDNAIPNIAEAVITIFSQVGQDTAALTNKAIKNWNSSPRENGVTANTTTNKLIAHLQSDCTKLGKTKEDMDTYSEKYKEKIIEQSFQKLVHEQQFKCAYSHAPLSITNSAQRFSFERIDTSKPHFGPEGDIDNIVFICRVFNSSAGMNRRKFLQCFLSQIHVPLSDDVRKKATAEYYDLVNKDNLLIKSTN